MYRRLSLFGIAKFIKCNASLPLVSPNAKCLHFSLHEQNPCFKTLFKKFLNDHECHMSVTLTEYIDLYSLAHKSENVKNLSDILIRDHDVKMYFTGPHGRGKIWDFPGSGHRRILKLWAGNLLSRDP